MDEDSSRVQDETPKQGAGVSEAVDAPEVRGEPVISEALRESGSLTMVADISSDELAGRLSRGERPPGKNPRMDLCCTRMAKAMLEDDRLAGTTRSEFAEKLGVSKPTVILHLGHLERDALVVGERARFGSGRSWLYKASPKLMEMKEQGSWVFISEDSTGGSRSLRVSAVEGPDGEESMLRPLVSSPEFAPFLESVVRTSKNPREAARRMGYRQPGAMRRHMKKHGIKPPEEWRRRPHLGRLMQQDIPETVIQTTVGRAWVAALIQGEGCIQSIYRKESDTTYLEVHTSMTDAGPINRLAGYLGVAPSLTPTRNHDWKPQWRKNIAGLRALRVLQEVLPWLVGQKEREARKAMEFFGPRGYHRGEFRNGDVWPREEFPLRSKRRGTNTALIAEQIGLATTVPRGVAHGKSGVPEVIIPSIEHRAWVAALIQGEGCIACCYVSASDSTSAQVTIGNTDPATISKFSNLVGLSSHVKAKYRGPELMPIWRKTVYGIRAIRLLREILPFLEGDKRREAEKALSFFDSNGYYRGRARPTEIWPASEFPLRSRKPKAGQGRSPRDEK